MKERATLMVTLTGLLIPHITKALTEPVLASGNASMLTGIQKIKLAGAEKRSFARWLNLYAQGAEYTFNPPTFIKINSVINMAIFLASTVILYYLAVQSNVDQSSYFAFTAAYTSVMGAFSSLAGIALTVAKIQSTLEMAKPFLEA